MSTSPPAEAEDVAQEVVEPSSDTVDAPPAEPATVTVPETQAPTETQVARFDDVFGGDDSDMSEDEDGPARDKHRGEADDEDEDEDEGEAYVPATETTNARIPSFKKRRGSGADSGDNEDGEDEEERQRKKKKRKERRTREEEAAAAEEEDEPVLDDATRRRHALEERIDNIGKKQRVVRRKKKSGGEDVDIVDSYHDDVCMRLRDRMTSAAEKDMAANRQKLPATNKLAMLDEVVNALQNTTLWSSIIDNEVLKAVKLWLEPLPDKSLPAVGIQKAIFEILPKMDLDTSTIREAQLGPVVLFYTKTKRVSPAINRQADALVQAWSRPIIKRSADFRSRFIPGVEEIERAASGDVDMDGDDDMDGERDEETQRPPRKFKPTAKPKRFDVRGALAENVHRKGARLPQSKDVQYNIAPESRLQHHSEDMQHVSRIQMDNKKFNRFARQLKSGRR